MGRDTIRSAIALVNRVVNSHELTERVKANPEVELQKLAEAVKFKPSIPSLPAKFYEDDSVKSGYIEIWFGK